MVGVSASQGGGQPERLDNTAAAATAMIETFTKHCLPLTEMYEKRGERTSERAFFLAPFFCEEAPCVAVAYDLTGAVGRQGC